MSDLVSKAEVLHIIDTRIEQLKKDREKIQKSYNHLSFTEGIHDGYCRLKCDIRLMPTVSGEVFEAIKECDT